MFQSGHARELWIQRYLKDVDKLLLDVGSAAVWVRSEVEKLLRSGCQVRGSNRGGVKTMTFTLQQRIVNVEERKGGKK